MQPLSEFTTEDVRITPPEVMSRVLAVKNAIIVSRLNILTSAPMAESCGDCAQYCREKWILTWIQHCVPALTTSLDQPLTLDDFHKIESIVRSHQIVCDICLLGGLSAIYSKLAEHNAMVSTAIQDWRSSLGFDRIEAIIETIRRRSQRDPLVQSGWTIEDDYEFLAHLATLGTLGL